MASAQTARTAGGVLGSLFWQRADGSGRAEALGDGKRIQRAWSVVADGSKVLFSEGAGLLSLSLDGRREVKTILGLVQSAGGVRASPVGDCVVSHDGQWFAYVEFDLWIRLNT